MEPDDTGLSSYYHQQRHHQPPPQHHNNHQNPSPSPTITNTNAAVSSGTNGIDRPAAHMVYPHSVPSAAAPPLETVRRKRGRPRKYGTPEQAAAAKRLSSSSPSPSSLYMAQHRKKDQSSLAGGSSVTYKKFHLAALGNQGQGFAPHIINVAAGEDVGQKIMVFMQQSKSEICILSASGAISNASLRQPATSGGNITYEGRFDILSLCGSFVRTELGGKTGGLSVCLASNDGQIIGGGVGGPLIAAGPVQVIVGTFLINTKKDSGTGLKGDASTSKLPSPISGTPLSSLGFLSAIDASGRIVTSGSDDHQNSAASQFTMSRGMQLTPPRSTDWRGSTDSRSSAGFDFSGRMGHGAEQSPENGDYDQFQD